MVALLMLSSPVKGYPTSDYGWRTLGGRRVFHGGQDIGTGGVAAPVYAIADAVFEKIVRHRERGEIGGVQVAPGRTGNAPILRHANRDRALYGHVMTAIGWRVGDKIKAGQLVGYVDLSGNTSGYHLHLELWDINGSTRDPAVYFRRAGIAIGAPPRKAYTGPRVYPHIELDGQTATVRETSSAFRTLLLSIGYRTPSNTAGGLMQTWLDARGFDVGPIDGRFGERSVKALQRLLQGYGYDGPISGRWNRRTVIAAAKLLNSQRDRIDR